MLNEPLRLRSGDSRHAHRERERPSSGGCAIANERNYESMIQGLAVGPQAQFDVDIDHGGSSTGLRGMNRRADADRQIKV